MTTLSLKKRAKFAFWRHSARETVQLLQQGTPDFISPEICFRQTVWLTQKPSRLQNLGTDAV